MFDFEGSRSEFLKLLAEMGEEPAFINRAKAPQSALDALLKSSAAHYDELLEWPRQHYANLKARIVDDWSRIQRLVAAPDDRKRIEIFESQLAPLVKPKVPFLSSDRSLLKQFLDSATRFNESWLRFVDGPGLEHVNQLRENYNRFYPMEKACAFGTDRINEGFEELPPLDSAFLLERFPLLEIPECR